MVRGFVGLVATLIVVGLLISVGAGIYNAGVAQGIVDAGRFPAGAAVPVAGYGYGWHGGPGIFGILIGLFFLFILIGIIRAAFFGGRGRGGWGHHGWGHHGHGDGPGPWGRDFEPGEGRRSWREERESRIADWHRRLHDEEAAAGGRSGGTSATTSPGSTSSS